MTYIDFEVSLEKFSDRPRLCDTPIRIVGLVTVEDFSDRTDTVAG